MISIPAHLAGGAECCFISVGHVKQFRIIGKLLLHQVEFSVGCLYEIFHFGFCYVGHVDIPVLSVANAGEACEEDVDGQLAICVSCYYATDGKNPLYGGL